MNDPEMRKDCPMRGSLGNCSPVGGFCMDAVSDEICEAVHNAYDYGFYNALKTMKEQKEKMEHLNNITLEYEKEVFRLQTLLKEQEAKQGKWERQYSRPGVFANLFWWCSVCGKSTSYNDAGILYQYCPHCGAKLEPCKEEW